MQRASMVVLSLALAGCGQINVERRVEAYRETEARRLIGEYQQAQAGGDLLSMCVKSNLISGLHLDANDAGSAQAWKARNAEDCRAARAAVGAVVADRWGRHPTKLLKTKISRHGRDKPGHDDQERG